MSNQQKNTAPNTQTTHPAMDEKDVKKIIKKQRLIAKLHHCDKQVALVQHVLDVPDLYISSDALSGLVENLTAVRRLLQKLQKNQQATAH